MSITIIDKIKEPISKAAGIDVNVPVFRTELERTKYWKKEEERWREGYGDGHARLSGMHYFYLTQCHLKDGSDANIIRPSYRDCDEWIINELHQGFWNPTQAIGILKRRELGLTSIGAGLLPFYTFRMFPGSSFGMTSADKDRIFKAFSDKTEVVLDKMHADIKPQLLKTNMTKQSVFLQLGIKKRNNEDEIELLKSEFFAKETSQSDKAAAGLAGTRLKCGFFDELPLHARRRLLLRVSRACFLKSMNYTGLLVWGGSFESTLSSEQIQDFQKMVADAEVLKHKVIFAPAWWGLVMNAAGESDEKAGVEKVLREREALEKTGDEDELRAHKLNFPLELKDIFDLGSSSRWEEYTRERINLRVSQLVKESKPILPYNLTESFDKIIAEPDTKSSFTMLEPPMPDVKYMLGVDATQSTDTTSAGKTNSKFCMYVMKGIGSQNELEFAPVARLRERPKDFDITFDKAIRVLKYYNQFGNAKITGELNATGGVLVSRILKSPTLKKCVLAGTEIKVKGVVKTKKPWFYRNDDVIDAQYMYANTYIKKYAEMIWFADILYDAQKSEDENKDDLDAFLACLFGWRSGDIIGELPKEPKKISCWVITGHRDGKPIWEEKTFVKRK